MAKAIEGMKNARLPSVYTDRKWKFVDLNNKKKKTGTFVSKVLVK